MPNEYISTSKNAVKNMASFLCPRQPAVTSNTVQTTFAKKTDEPEISLGLESYIDDMDIGQEPIEPDTVV